MRKFVFAFLFACMTPPSVSQAETVLAFWDFNDGYDVGGGAVQVALNATMGSGILYQQRADIDGNGKGGFAYANPLLSINSVDGQALTWSDVGVSGDNDAELFFQTSTLGYSNIKIRFDVRGNGDAGISRYDLKYDLLALEDATNPGDVVGTIKDFAGGASTSILNNQALATDADTFVTETIDLASLSAVNDQGIVVFRMDDIKDNDQMRIDNLLITGVASVPEPSSVAGVCGIATVILMRRRRRSNLV